jgi:hypothetical protein
VYWNFKITGWFIVAKREVCEEKKHLQVIRKNYQMYSCILVLDRNIILGCWLE